MNNLPFILVFALQIPLAGQITIFVQIAGCLNPAAALGDSRFLLPLEILIGIWNDRIPLNCQFLRQIEHLRFYREQPDQPQKIILIIFSNGGDGTCSQTLSQGIGSSLYFFNVPSWPYWAR